MMFSGKLLYFTARGSLWVACCRAQSPWRDAQHRVCWQAEAGIAPGNGQQGDKRQGNRLQCLAQLNVSWQPNIGFAGKAVLLTQVVSRRLQMERGQFIVDQRMPTSHIFSGEQILFRLFRLRAPVEADSVPSLPYCTRLLL